MVFFKLNASFTRASKNAHVSRKSATKEATKVSGTILTGHNYTTSSHKQQVSTKNVTYLT